MATAQVPTEAVTAPAEPDPTPTPPARAAARPPQTRPRIDFQDPEYRALVRRMCCTKSEATKSATDDEFDLFMRYCERMQLDPLAKQVYFMKRGREDDADKRGGPELAIDSLRLIAERTGEYCGQTPREWADVVVNRGEAHITWHPVWPFKDRTPYACRVGIYRAGFAEPLYAIARWDAYVQTAWKNQKQEPNRMWAKMGPEQLGKCAEALGLRQAFPNELGGSYTTDEMGQAENDAEAPQRAQVRQQQRQRRPAAQRAGQASDPAPTPEPHPLAVVAGVEWTGTPPVLFRYGVFKGVPLNQTWPAPDQWPAWSNALGDARQGHPVGQYVIPVEKLQEAEGKTSDRLKEYQRTGDQVGAQAATAYLDALADELSQRADDASTADGVYP